MEDKPTTLSLTDWQQKMIKDMFGITTATLDVSGVFSPFVKYGGPYMEASANQHVQRMYLEDAQKGQIAKLTKMKNDKLCDYIELDYDKIVRYAAINNILYGGAAPCK